MTHIIATAAVIASVELSVAAEVFITRKYISSADSGPANKVIFFVFWTVTFVMSSKIIHNLYIIL